MDLDDNEGRSKAETTKKGAKARKTAADAASGAGPGVTTNGATNGTAPQPKRRKVEKPAAATAPADRALAGVFGTDAPKTKTSSPRAGTVSQATQLQLHHHQSLERFQTPSYLVAHQSLLPVKAPGRRPRKTKLYTINSRCQ
ncbi:conserved hypothetical protein [Verticillium alfalfae VaMs.102]|uniref:Uncharacterized protein n=1 Tax=Verticillium alfalfae (strain VaMs.102 / ATCC MYA-4576 / FGSC 10136) TaxID=526221 RepID=C9SKK9_VERA1|nr:conserved hypothetical protein [Verticillium alfalfae VaMs.102]EEY19227.1 conserved hypothetical protein [Verticillium alfalfae VaMs.102]